MCEQNEKILVIGSTVAMGRYLVPELARKGYDVTGVSVDAPCYEGARHIKGNAFDKEF